MKKIISLFLTVTMIASLIVAIPAGNVAAAETITDEALFMTYPTYLSNSEMDEGLQKAETAYYAVINSYSNSDEVVAKAVTMLSEGVDIAFNESLAALGITHNYYETCVKKAAKKYMQSMIENENVLKKATKKVQTAYKNIKTVYSTATVVAKEELIIELTKVAAENDIGISTKAMDAYVKSAYESGTLKKDLDAIGAVNDLWKYVIEFSELHAIEMTTLDLLMEELLIAGQEDNDLFIGLGLLKEDIEKDKYYILENYATKTVISLLSKFVDELIGNVTGTVHLALIKSCIKIFCDYVYVNAKADEITQAIIQTSFVNSVDICLSKYRLKFLQGKGTTADIETYENLYALSISARIAILDTCYDVAKITDKFSLGGDCMVWKDLLEYNYTYDNYIKWCKQAIAHDIANAELDKTTGASTITDALNDETIKARLDKISSMSLYEPNAGKTFNGEYNGAKGSLGFAARVFGFIFDKQMGTKVENRYNHVLTNNKNVRIIGRLEEDDVTETALKDLFANVRIGDIVITSGQYDYLHAMVVVSVEDNGVVVYDCDSPYNSDAPEDMRPFTIQEYKMTYKKMADAFSESGEYMSVPGISVYRAINKVNTTNSGSNLYYEEYDDSVNYVIENGVLTGYKGSRTTIEIPDGVTSIADECFSNNHRIKYVYMPDTITNIGWAAFSFCDNLQYVKLSNNLKHMSAAVFQGCSSLTNIILPNSLWFIGGYAFTDSALASVNIPDSVEYIEWHAFENCTNLKTITIGEKVRRFYSSAMKDCVNLETVYWNSSDKGVYNDFGGAFWNAGKNCGGFTVIFGNNVTEIPSEALSGANYLKSAVIPEGVTKIGSEAFQGCNSLDNVNLPESLIRIEDQAFYSCDSLQSITIPQKVTYMGEDAFAYCNNIETIYWDAVEVSNFTRMSSPFYSYTTGIKNKKVIFGNTVKSIPDHVLHGHLQVTEITIGENVERIGEGAFDGCNVKELVIPDSVTTIEWSALSDLQELTGLVIPDSVTTIEWGAIQNCDSLANLTLPSYTDDTILNGIRLSNLQNVYISPSSKDFESLDGVLYGRDAAKTLAMVPSGRKTITILKECKEIGWDAFYNDLNVQSHLQEIKVEKGNTSFTSIDGNLYSYDGKELIKYAAAKNGTTFNVPQNVTTIKRRAFSNATNLSEVIIPDSVQNIESETFECCTNLKKITLPKGISVIPDFSFSISGISNITIPDTVEKIGRYAFQNCTNLKDIYYEGTESDWKKISVDEGNEYLLNATIHYNQTTKTKITDLTVDNTGKITLTAINVPTDAVIYVASYDTLGKLLEIQRLTLNDGSASAIFSTSSVHKYKAFIWEGNTIRPLSNPKEYIFN